MGPRPVAVVGICAKLFCVEEAGSGVGSGEDGFDEVGAVGNGRLAEEGGRAVVRYVACSGAVEHFREQVCGLEKGGEKQLSKPHLESKG